MSNMSYCRFQNTCSDLDDCYDNMEYPDNLSSAEQAARLRIIKLAEEIIRNYGHEINVEIADG